MNISDLNHKIYGYKELNQGDFANFKIDLIEQQEMVKCNSNPYEFDKITKEIKF